MGRLNAEALQKFDEAGMLYLILGSLISADNNVTREEMKQNLTVIRDLREVVPDTNFSDEKKEVCINYLNDGEKIILRDLGELDD